MAYSRKEKMNNTFTLRTHLSVEYSRTLATLASLNDLIFTGEEPKFIQKISELKLNK